MATTPRFKVYNPSGEYVAAVKHPEDGAAICAAYGPGSQIRDGHKRVVYEDGKDGDAGNSYDEAAAVVLSRIA